MYGGVIEATVLLVRWKIYVTGVGEDGTLSLPCRLSYMVF